ncbi:MAG: hypothetical protein R3C44_24660 [Chloroflexota bacterium]
MALHLDLTTLSASADGDLLQRVPHDLAAYYQALPLAHEEGRVTVVTPHPDNRAAIQVLTRLLEAEVVPVSGSESAAAAAIEQLYQPQALNRQLVSWSDDPLWQDRVRETAERIGTTVGLTCSHLDYGVDTSTLLDRLAQTPDALLICRLSNPQRLAELMQHTSASLLLVRGESRSPRRTLVALRGYGSDHAALLQLRSLPDQGQAVVTVLPLAHGHGWLPDRLLRPDAPDRLHLDGCLHGLGTVPVSVRLRAGDPSEQLVAELSQEAYDLLVIAAEGWGEFVSRTLDQVIAAGVLPDQPVLIIRPPAA